MKLIMKDQINSNGYEYKGKNLWLSINITFVFLYIILKMYRNSINNTAEVTGGIWNVFNILFIVLGFLSI
ncbi:MAG: hypothetical protein GX848_05950, partial [Clostridiales bacterium]|nr:hypothetical protein [Clostridiales bacterium]